MLHVAGPGEHDVRARFVRAEAIGGVANVTEEVERVLRVEPALAGRVRLHSTVGRTRIVFQGNGGNVGSNATFTLCDGRGPARARALIMGNAGTLRDGVATQANLDATCPR